MLKVTRSGKHHRKALPVAIVNAQLVPDRSAGLDHSRDPGLIGDLHTVREREKGIACHYCSIQIKMEAPRLPDRLLQGINPTRLSGTARQQLPVLCQHDGI